MSVLALTVLSGTTVFFGTNAGKATSDSDVASSRSDLIRTNDPTAPVNANGNETGDAVRRGTVEPKPMQARTAHITFTSKGPDLGFLINAGTPSVVYVDWGDGNYVRETSSDGHYYKESVSGENIRISGETTITSFICYQSSSDHIHSDSSYMTVFDSSSCTMLEELDISSNLLVGTLDLTANEHLKKLNVSKNSLTGLKVSSKATLAEFDCSQNCLLFPNIDVPYGTQGSYSPQTLVFVVPQNTVYDTWMEELGPGTVLLKKANGSSVTKSTVYNWQFSNNQSVTSGITADNGKFKFAYSLLGKNLKCTMTNEHFKNTSGEPEPLTVSTTVVPGTVTFTLTLDDDYPPKNQTAQFIIGLNSDAQHVFVDFDNVDENRYKVREANNPFALVSERRRIIKYYAENVTSLTIPAGTVKAADLSGLTDLKSLTVSDNPSLTSLDLTGLTALETVRADGCGLTALTLPTAPHLTTLDASGNRLLFSTVRQPAGFTNGNYSNQNNAAIELATPVSVGEAIDLSTEYVDTGTVYTWTGGAAPTVNGGVVTFGTDDIGKTTAATITHPAYPGLTVRTTSTQIQPGAETFSMTSSADSGSFAFALNNDATKVYVDFGNGYVAKSGGHISGTLSGHAVKVYAENVTSLSAPSQNLTGMAIDGLTDLLSLDCSHNPALGLPVLSGNTALTTLNCSGNGLTALDTSALPHLTTLNCSDNVLTALDTSALPYLTTLDASGNQLLFSTVRQPAGFTNGDYSNQNNAPMEIAAAIRIRQTLDLSAEYVDADTVYTWTGGVAPTVTDGVVTFGTDDIGKTTAAAITHPAYPGLTVRTTSTQVKSIFMIDDGGIGVIAEPDDNIILETEDGHPIDIDDVILRIVHLNEAELTVERQAITDAGFSLGADNPLDGYDIQLVSRSGQRVRVVSEAGIRIILPYGTMTREGHTFVTYHNDTENGVEVIPCDALTQGVAFIGKRFSPYCFAAYAPDSGEGNGSSGTDDTPSGTDGGSAIGSNTGGPGKGSPGTGESAVAITVTLLLSLLSIAVIITVCLRERRRGSGDNTKDTDK